VRAAGGVRDLHDRLGAVEQGVRNAKRVCGHDLILPSGPDGSRGDELPAELADRRSRRERLRRCKEELKRHQAAEEHTHAENLARRAAWEQEHGRRLAGRKPTPPDPGALERRMINTSDPDTRRMKRAGRRSVQGYNVQVVASEEQLIVTACVTQAPNDSDQL
jgi:hypothetical protein